MNQIQEIFLECQRCGQVRIVARDVPMVPFEKKAFQVMCDILYINTERIDDYKMVCKAIKRAKFKDSLEYNDHHYEIRDGILYIDKERIGDYEMAIEAVKRAQELTREFHPGNCINIACGRNGPFKVISPEVFKEAMTAFDSKNYLKAVLLFRDAKCIYTEKRDSTRIDECSSLIKRCEEFLGRRENQP